MCFRLCKALRAHAYTIYNSNIYNSNAENAKTKQKNNSDANASLLYVQDLINLYLSHHRVSIIAGLICSVQCQLLRGSIVERLHFHYGSGFIDNGVSRSPFFHFDGKPQSEDKEGEYRAEEPFNAFESKVPRFTRELQAVAVYSRVSNKPTLTDVRSPSKCKDETEECQNAAADKASHAKVNDFQDGDKERSCEDSEREYERQERNNRSANQATKFAVKFTRGSHGVEVVVHVLLMIV